MDNNFTSRPKKMSENDSKSNHGSHLILHNDDINSFDYVMDTLVEVCDHSPEQAEQCAMIAHYKGKCGIRSGIDNETLKEMRYRLISKGLKATIE